MKAHTKYSMLALGLILGGLVLFQACESVLFIELEEGVKLIVLNGTLTDEDSVAIQVSRTRHILDNAPVAALEDARVILLENGNEAGSLEYEGNGYYVMRNFTPAVGNEYTLEVSREGYPSVTATSMIPPPVPIAALDTVTVTDNPEGDDYYYYGGTFLQFDLSLEDPAGEENYYLLSVTADRSWTNYLGDTTVKILDSVFLGGQWYYDIRDSIYPLYEIERYQYQANLITEDIIVEAYTPDGLIFSDHLIDGKAYSVRARLQEGDLRSADSTILDFQLKSITEEYFKYLKTRTEHYNTREDYLSVPVIVYSNVVEGTGFLGGYTADRRTITTFVPEYYWDYPHWE